MISKKELSSRLSVILIFVFIFYEIKKIRIFLSNNYSKRINIKNTTSILKRVINK
jgi:hypothetical protein